jgi:hypothetical protein
MAVCGMRERLVSGVYTAGGLHNQQRAGDAQRSGVDIREGRGGEVSYDSTADTKAHINRVSELIEHFVHNLEARAEFHDATKLTDPEKEVFDRVTPQLKALTYGSEEYKASLASMGEALRHHYANNRHHPEHHRHGVNDMNLLDVVEMLCDWKAATERHADGSIAKSLDMNPVRFGIDYQLATILRNTVRDLGWHDAKKEGQSVP